MALNQRSIKEFQPDDLVMAKDMKSRSPEETKIWGVIVKRNLLSHKYKVRILKQTLLKDTVQDLHGHYRDVIVWYTHPPTRPIPVMDIDREKLQLCPKDPEKPE